MLDRERLSRQLRDCALLFFVVFLGLSLGGYDPADAPGMSVVPPNAAARNPCGPVGATLAHAAFQTFGIASYGLVWGLLVLDIYLMSRRRVPESGLRALGFLMVLAVASALIRRFGPDLRPSPPVGTGGYVGALAVAFIGGQFGNVGMLLFLGAIGLVGLLLCSEALFVWPILDLLGLIRPRRVAALPAPSNPHSEPRPAIPHPAALEFSPPPGRAELARPVHERPPAGQPDLMPVPVRRGAGPQSSIPISAGDGSYIPPPVSLLDPAAHFPIQEHEALIHSRALLLEKTFLEFGCQVRVVQIDTGPVITQFEIELEAGLRVAKINSIANDLAIALAVPNVRIVSPIPGKTTVGIEVPNDRRMFVKLGEVIEGAAERLARLRIPLFLGKDVKGMPLAFDLAEMPHLLIAGRTGTGKSVCLNAMIISILMTKSPDEVKMILIDPKQVELSQFKRIPHLMHPVITDNKKAESLLAWACDKMDERYGYLARAEVRNISSYNALGAEEIFRRLRPEDAEEQKNIPTFMPWIVIIIDEMGDLIAQVGKEVETHIVRLAQKARAAGIHLILATQKPTVDVITGLIKSNLPARIAFQVSSRNDSRVVLDEMGAEKLLGNGDMLFLIPGTSHLVRAQGTYVSDAEVNRVCEYLLRYPVDFSRELVQRQVNGTGKDSNSLKDRDDLYEAAIEVVIREGRGSSSLLQRAMGIGYGRASRMIDFMAEDGIVGEYKSGSAREVLYTWEEWESIKNGEAGGAAA
jgi:DNA segregation ATPase FtsK/SpoIIIE, S-DNA-T family